MGLPRNQKEINVDSAMDVVTPAQNDIGCASGLGITDEDAPSDKISVKPVIPPRERVQIGLGGEPGQSSRGDVCKEKRCLPSVLERGAHLSGYGEVDMGVASEILPPTTLDDSHALDSAGTRGLWDSLICTSDSSMYAILDASEADSDVPLALRVQRGPKRHRFLPEESPEGRMKKNGRAKMDWSGSVDVDASNEDFLLGGSRLSDLQGFHHIY